MCMVYEYECMVMDTNYTRFSRNIGDRIVVYQQQLSRCAGVDAIPVVLV